MSRSAKQVPEMTPTCEHLTSSAVRCSPTGRTIKGAWEGSAEGSQRKHDFDLNYVRPG